MAQTLLQPRPVNVSSASASLSPAAKDQAADLLVIVLGPCDLDKERKDTLVTAGALELDKVLGGLLSRLVALKDFEAGWLETSASLAPEGAPARRVLLLGTGTKNDNAAARARHLGVRVGEESLKAKAESVSLVAFGTEDYSAAGGLAQMALGFHLGAYKFPPLRPTDEQRKALETPLSLKIHSTAPGLAEQLRKTETLARSIRQARLLQDGPPNLVTPEHVSDVARRIAQDSGLGVQVFGAQKLREMGMNAMMAVGGGSSHEPQLITLEYKPAQYTKTLALVGKGLTMDTGGYSVKTPSVNQIKMKYDMSGSAIVINAISAIKELGLPIRVVAVAAMCENMIDAHAYRVGDILTTYAGKTVEVLNTDAEGRIVLSDALAYATKDLAADYVLEFSTLTGAMITTLGTFGAGVFAFNDESFGQTVMGAAEKTGERAWRLPVWEDVKEDIKGNCSDLTNISTVTGAGSIIAALFLNEFVNGKPFVHVDIAGVANDSACTGYPRKLSSGFGLQLAVGVAEALSARGA